MKRAIALGISRCPSVTQGSPWIRFAPWGRNAPAESAGVTEGLLNQIAPDVLAPHRARIESQGPKWPSGLQEARGFAPPRPLGLGRREGRNEPVSPAELLARLEETLSCSEVVPAARGSKPSLLR
jgi:hypothetical protein